LAEIGARKELNDGGLPPAKIRHHISNPRLSIPRNSPFGTAQAGCARQAQGYAQVEAHSAEETEVLLAAGRGHRHTLGELVHIELEAVLADEDS
jgi:hypothetical protein